jgi:hypothetical protein
MSKRAMNSEREKGTNNVPTGKSITVKPQTNAQKKPQDNGGCCK